MASVVAAVISSAAAATTSVLLANRQSAATQHQVDGQLQQLRDQIVADREALHRTEISNASGGLRESDLASQAIAVRLLQRLGLDQPEFRRDAMDELSEYLYRKSVPLAFDVPESDNVSQTGSNLTRRKYICDDSSKINDRRSHGGQSTRSELREAFIALMVLFRAELSNQTGAQEYRLDLSSTCIGQVSFGMPTLAGIDLRDSQMFGTDFTGENLACALISDATMQDVIIRDTVLASADLRGSNISASEEGIAIFDDVDLRWALQDGFRIAEQVKIGVVFGHVDDDRESRVRNKRGKAIAQPYGKPHQADGPRCPNPDQCGLRFGVT